MLYSSRPDKVCIFDQDDYSTREMDRCKVLGYGIAIIDNKKDVSGITFASPDEKYQIWSGESPYIDIMEYNGINPDEWKNSIVFDDDIPNLNIAYGLGFNVVQLQKQI